MATKVVQSITCDEHLTTEVEATASHEFSLDGVDYRIDLCEQHEAKFIKAVSTFTEHATIAPRQITSKKGKKPPVNEEAQAMRDWARKNGHEVRERGRIPSTVVEAYKAAHRGVEVKAVKAAA